MPHSFFISTRNGKHALVIIDHVNTTVSSDCNTITKEFTIMSGLRIDWYLQNDGTMDFSEITHVKNTKTPKLSANSQGFKIRSSFQLHHGILKSPSGDLGGGKLRPHRLNLLTIGIKPYGYGILGACSGSLHFDIRYSSFDILSPKNALFDSTKPFIYIKKSILSGTFL